MSRSFQRPGCLTPGCKLPAEQDASGAYRRSCIEHTPKPLTLRERIAAGPKFVHIADTHCLACQVFDSTDGETGLCVTRCWPAWRWSAIREYEQP